MKRSWFGIVAIVCGMATGLSVGPVSGAPAARSVPGFPCTSEEDLAAVQLGTLSEDVQLQGLMSSTIYNDLNMYRFFRGCASDTKARVAFNHPVGGSDAWKVKSTSWIIGELVFRASSYSYGDAVGERANCTLTIGVDNGQPPPAFRPSWSWKQIPFTSRCPGAASSSVRLTLTTISQTPLPLHRGRLTALPATTVARGTLHRAPSLNPCYLKSDGRRHRPGSSSLPWLYKNGRHYVLIGATGVVKDADGHRYVTTVETDRFTFTCAARGKFR